MLKIAAGTLYEDQDGIIEKDVPLRDRREAAARLLDFQRAKKSVKHEVNHSGTVESKVTYDAAPAIKQIHQLLEQQKQLEEQPTNTLDESIIIDGEAIPVDNK